MTRRPDRVLLSVPFGMTPQTKPPRRPTTSIGIKDGPALNRKSGALTKHSSAVLFLPSG